MSNFNESITRLKEGNKRYRKNKNQTVVAHEDLKEGQTPFAIILSCADSRVPVEVVFDQALGDLFTVRVAGNIAKTSQIGSIEYAVDNLGTPLIVVLGHSHCGAVSATLSEMKNPSEDVSPHIGELVSYIKTGLEGHSCVNSDDPLQNSVVRNVEYTIEVLSQESNSIKEKVAKGELKIVGAWYSLETGEVYFL